nr:thioredoxin [Plantibacter sp. CFBP 8798]
MQARAVLAEVPALVAGAVVEERDVAFRAAEAEADGIRSTPTVIITADDGTEVFRATGAPTLNQVLVAAAKGL